MKNSPFFKQAELMVRVLPTVAAEECFALKGGTAINLFLRDIPRLSVDIDLTYLPIEPREASLSNIHEALKRIAGAVKKSISGVKVQEGIGKLFINNRDAQIKIEPNEVIRGTVYPCEEHNLSKKAEKLFELSVSATTLSLADLFGGKLCAALDRQHPRDLFDVKLLLENEGITDEIRKAFVVYLASHDRPIHELIDPPRKNVRTIFDREFSGMTAAPVQYQDLIETRETFIDLLKTKLTLSEKKFLVSLKEGLPKWDLLGIKGIENLPAIQWKLMNIKKMEKKKHLVFLKNLKDKLEM